PRGTRLGRFGSLREIGRGGMGVVYKAWDDPNHRWVALKVISDKQSLEILTRVRKELEITRTLQHPNIVGVHEISVVDGRQLIAMQWIDGTTLAGERTAPRRAAELIGTIAQALHYAHSKGVVHRGIKPQNIMMDRDGKPYIVDFCLARAGEAPTASTPVK